MPTRIFACRPEGPTLEPTPESLPELMAAPDVLVWVSLDQAGEREKTLLTDVFRLHELLVEDALNVAPTPKTEAHDDYLYVILHGLHPDGRDKPGDVRTVDVDFFLGDDFIVTHHRVGLPSLTVVRNEVARDPSLLRRGPAFIAHRLADLMVDEYLPTMEVLDKEIIQIEEAAIRSPDPRLLERIFATKHSLQRLQRIGIHQRQILRRLSEGLLPHVPEESFPFWRDIDDHFVQVMDLNESYRELLAASSEAYLTMQSHHLNDVMKILTVISTIMLPLTFVTGLYGMNFDTMPLVHWDYGFEGSVAAMALSALLSFWWMKRRRWI